MTAFLRTFRPETGWVCLVCAAAAVVAWGVATVVLTLATLIAYALLRLPVLLTLHDQAAFLAAGLVAVAGAGLAARALVGEG